jgi:iron complex outermembrane receptor protein
LKPETDYSAEMGVVYNLTSKNERFFMEAEVSGYYSYMLDLIMWTPTEDGSVWMPENINEVLARGIETGLNLNLKVGGFDLMIANTYNFCRSTYENVKSPTDSSLGKQLIYIPEHTLNLNASVKKSGFYLIYNFSFVSKRYTGTDNKTAMPPYYLSNIILGKNFLVKKLILSLQLQIGNLFDLDYQSIASRPMPGRNYALTLRFNFKK